MYGFTHTPTWPCLLALMLGMQLNPYPNILPKYINYYRRPHSVETMAQNMAIFFALATALVLVGGASAAHAQTTVQGQVGVEDSPPTLPNLTVDAVRGETVTVTFTGVTDPNNEPVALAIQTTGNNVAIPSGSQPFADLISNLDGFAEGTATGTYDVTDQAQPDYTTPVSISFTLSADATVGDYVLGYTGTTQNPILVTGPSTITITVQPNAPTLVPIVETFRHPDAISINFAEHITYEGAAADLAVAMTLTEPADPMITATAGADANGNTYSITSADRIATFSNDDNARRTLTGTFTATDTFNGTPRTTSSDVTILLLPANSGTDSAAPTANPIEIRQPGATFEIDFTQFVTDTDTVFDQLEITFVADDTSEIPKWFIEDTSLDQVLDANGDVTSHEYTILPGTQMVDFVDIDLVPRTAAFTYTVSDGTDSATSTISLEKQDPAAICSAAVSGDINFGALAPGGTSADQTLTITNDGGADFTTMIEGADWFDSAGGSLIDVGGTRYSTTTGQGHPDKTPLSATVATVGGSISSTETTDIYLSVNLALKEPTFKGTLTQQITISTSC